MREVDLLHETHDQHEAEGDQRQQQPEHQTIQHMGKEIEHAAAAFKFSL